MTIEQVREKYPTANYAPDPECKKCAGRGEWFDGRTFEFAGGPQWHACICIFVEHSFAPTAAAALAKVARDYRESK